MNNRGKAFDFDLTRLLATGPSARPAHSHKAATGWLPALLGRVGSAWRRWCAAKCRRRWENDAGLRALANLTDDDLCDLSDTGRRRSREARWCKADLVRWRTLGFSPKGPSRGAEPRTRSALTRAPT